VALDVKAVGSQRQGPADLAPGAALPAALSALVERLRAAPAEQRPPLAAALVRELEKAGPGEDAGAVAAVVLRALDSRLLVDLETPDGVAARAEAVGALLRLGFPWALHVDPVDLQFFRERGGRRRRTRAWLVAALLALAALAGAGYLLATHALATTHLDPPTSVFDPRVVSEVRVPLPPEARAAGVTGPVPLQVEVLPDGRVRSVDVLFEPGYGAGEAARAAVKQFRFEPYDSRPLERSRLVNYTYTFAPE